MLSPRLAWSVRRPGFLGRRRSERMSEVAVGLADSHDFSPIDGEQYLDPIFHEVGCFAPYLASSTQELSYTHEAESGTDKEVLRDNAQ